MRMVAAQRLLCAHANQGGDVSPANAASSVATKGLSKAICRIGEQA